MREIKFRAWDGCNTIEKMRIGEAEYLDDMLSFRFQHFEGDNPAEIVYEQYTGLKDKNGKEIYEGDIISRVDNRPMEVRWSENIAAFVLSCGPEVDQILSGDFADYHEVISNIHKDPKWFIGDINA